jgi:hypothetical protein
MEVSDELRSLEATGIYRLAGSLAAFLDPVRLLSESYRRFRLIPSAYYSRSFGPSNQEGHAQGERKAPSPDRKKQRQPRPRELNAVEQIAEARHQVTMCYIVWISLLLFPCFNNLFVKTESLKFFISDRNFTFYAYGVLTGK